MGDDDAERFLGSIGVTAARKVLTLLDKANCLLIGIGGGIALATGPMRAAQGSLKQSASTSATISRHASPVPARRMNLLMMLATLGTATVVAGGACSIAKLKLRQYLDAHATYASAMSALTPELKLSLYDHARRLLAIADLIEEAFEEERRVGINPDLVA